MEAISDTIVVPARSYTPWDLGSSHTRCVHHTNTDGMLHTVGTHYLFDGTGSQFRFQKVWQKWADQGLDKGRIRFYNFSVAPAIYKKIYKPFAIKAKRKCSPICDDYTQIFANITLGLVKDQIFQRRINKFLQSMRSKGLLSWPIKS